MSFTEDSTVRIGKIWIPGQRVTVIAGPYEGLMGSLVSSGDNQVLIRVDKGVYIRSPEIFVKRLRRRDGEDNNRIA